MVASTTSNRGVVCADSRAHRGENRKRPGESSGHCMLWQVFDRDVVPMFREAAGYETPMTMVARFPTVRSRGSRAGRRQQGHMRHSMLRKARVKKRRSSSFGKPAGCETLFRRTWNGPPHFGGLEPRIAADFFGEADCKDLHSSGFGCAERSCMNCVAGLHFIPGMSRITVRRIALLEPATVFALIMAYIWQLRYSHRGLWLAILAGMIVSHLVRRESSEVLGFHRR